MRQLTEARWMEIYAATVRSVYRYLSRRGGGDRDLAEDLTQETFLRALDAWRKNGPPDDPQAWLIVTGRNLLASHFCRRRPEALRSEDVEDLGVGELALEAPTTPRGAALLEWGLSRLRARQASLIEAYHLEGKPVAVIARETGVSERAIEGRLRRSRIALQKHLEPFLQPGPRTQS